MNAEMANSSDRAHQRLEADAFYRHLIKLLMPLVERKSPRLFAISALIKLRQRLDEIWGLDLGKQLERDGISDALLAVLHEVQARPLALPSPDESRAALTPPGAFDTIWEEMERSGEVSDGSRPPEPESETLEPER